MAQTMSFLPEDYLQRRLRKRTNFICFGLFCVVVCAIFAAYIATNRQTVEVNTEMESLNRQLVDAAKLIEKAEELKLRRVKIMRKANLTASLLERVPRSIVLAELVNNMPSSMTLLEINSDTRTVKIAAPKPTTALDAAKRESDAAARKKTGEPEPELTQQITTLQIVGVAPTDMQVASFMTALGKRSLFQDINLVFSEQVVFEQQNVRKFRFDLRLNNEVDVQKLEPLLVKREVPRNPMADRMRVTPDGAITSLEPALNAVFPASMKSHASMNKD